MRFSTLLKAVVLLAIVGAVAGFVLTMPSGIPADALAPRTADLANGETMFHIGGCASCHATPHQDDQTKLGGGLALTTPFGTLKVPKGVVSARPPPSVVWSS